MAETTTDAATALSAIAEDRTLSPYTGWTRAHWVALADATLAAVRPHASPRHALIRLPGPASVAGQHSDGLEGFARTFLAAGFRLAGSAGSTTGAPGGLAEWYAQGLAAGVDPASPERWPSLADTPQARVEAACLALALHESRAVLWDALPDRVRAQTVEWLAATIEQEYPACNWLWFQNIVQAFLRSVGGPWSAECVQRNIATVESWYLGDGWYTDGLAGAGTARNFDWYAGWAMHFYPLWYCRILGSAAEPAMAQRYRERLREYLAGAVHLFAPGGAPLHQGRSLTYRYAALAPVWAGAVFDATPLRPGATRRLASGTVRHFLAGGAWNAAGLHPIGWYGEFTPIRQPYSGAGSPYWASKGFAGLVLPADDPVWTDVEEPLAVERGDVALALPVPGWLVSGTRVDGVVRVVNHGTDHADAGRACADDPGYARHAYATHAGPEYGRDARHSPIDSHVTLVNRDGVCAHRSPLVPLGTRGRVGSSRYRAHWPVGPLPDAFAWPLPEPDFEAGPWVTTASVLRGAVEVRLARVDPDPATGDGTLPGGAQAEPVFGGAEHPPTLPGGAQAEPVLGGASAVGSPGQARRSRSSREDHHPQRRAGGHWMLHVGGYPIAAAQPPSAREATGEAVAWRADGLRCGVFSLLGLPDARVRRGTGTNAYGRHSATPVLATGAPVGYGRVYAAAVVLTGLGDVPLPRLALHVTDTGARATVHWPDGGTDDVHLEAP